MEARWNIGPRKTLEKAAPQGHFLKSLRLGSDRMVEDPERKGVCAMQLD